MKRTDTTSEKNWESICSKCGRCCYEKIDFEGRIYYTELPCEFLDPETRLCRVYAERDTQRPGCVRLTQKHLKKGFLPADCPYVAGVKNYPAPILPEEPDSENS
ncbi:MAG: hypothetical protein OEL80_04150 [Desulfuromonadales bacterium]|nr:hypothetical protein [Desulfuromonadales bacterium]